MIAMPARSIQLTNSKALANRGSRQSVKRACARQARAPVRAVFKHEVERESIQNKISSAATAALVASLSNPLVAEASITPSLKNALLSIVAGGVVLGAIAAAVVGVSSFDKVSRK